MFLILPFTKQFLLFLAADKPNPSEYLCTPSGFALFTRKHFFLSPDVKMYRTQERIITVIHSDLIYNNRNVFDIAFYKTVFAFSCCGQTKPFGVPLYTFGICFVHPETFFPIPGCKNAPDARKSQIKQIHSGFNF